MRSSLGELLALDRPLLADGATGTNFFGMGLGPGEPPELWNTDQPEKVRRLHDDFIAAGADIILTNTFGCNRYRLQLHGAEDRTREIAEAAATIAGAAADAVDRPVVVAGSVGPTGELLAPLGTMTEADARAAFVEEIEGLAAGGADVAWIETKSAPGEMRAAAQAAIDVGLPYTVTGSFDTAGRTMMGLRPGELADVFAGLPVAPLAIGANCGVGASDLLVAIQQMGTDDHVVIAKSNCGIPQFRGADVEYTGDPPLMGRYATLAVDSGARIIGGCCGTSPEHLAEMRRRLDEHERAHQPTLDEIVAHVGPLTNTAASAGSDDAPTRNRRRRRG
ncbi:MAG: betaine--homocysteine S-methyltransferase [Ilumatobacter sp.]|uniref:betaine--homocysteine S-methyltransferase n=1 Tax=Ilumatobacter sp. TaxID=1967498 RepID=UPI00261D07DA|nr:betaine--homocysteine S-methyltransferase [Ilumatobacter sp.]MDJ0770415.1 betaine--homocysteine S-methyltransferase [Ilumatobacter sp.]